MDALDTEYGSAEHEGLMHRSPGGVEASWLINADLVRTKVLTVSASQSVLAWLLFNHRNLNNDVVDTMKV